MALKIGISLRIVSAINYLEKRDALSHDWTNFLEKIGIIPIFIPNTFSNIKLFLDELNLDGLILSGGDNIGEFPERDNTEKSLIEYGINNKIPILGICRGMQLINKFYGGSIIETTNKKHIKINHEINLLDSIKENFSNENLISVNSYHHNIVTNDSLGNNLKSFAVCNFDDTVEGIIHTSNKIIGLMWHPERSKDDFNKKLIIQIFVENTFWNKK
jgi:N5-(cytidine 5'-diphosphoramidyl)-L-glutamine hydrolase